MLDALQQEKYRIPFSDPAGLRLDGLKKATVEGIIV
jgi:hypothetical protein